MQNKFIEAETIQYIKELLQRRDLLKVEYL